MKARPVVVVGFAKCRRKGHRGHRPGDYRPGMIEGACSRCSARPQKFWPTKYGSVDVPVLVMR